jgi:hypothetical protein
VDKEEEIVSLKLLVGSLNSSNNNPEEPFLTIPFPPTWNKKLSTISSESNVATYCSTFSISN